MDLRFIVVFFMKKSSQYYNSKWKQKIKYYQARSRELAFKYYYNNT